MHFLELNKKQDVKILLFIILMQNTFYLFIYYLLLFVFHLLLDFLT